MASEDNNPSSRTNSMNLSDHSIASSASATASRTVNANNGKADKLAGSLPRDQRFNAKASKVLGVGTNGVDVDSFMVARANSLPPAGPSVAAAAAGGVKRRVSFKKSGDGSDASVASADGPSGAISRARYGGGDRCVSFDEGERLSVSSQQTARKKKGRLRGTRKVARNLISSMRRKTTSSDMDSSENASLVSFSDSVASTPGTSSDNLQGMGVKVQVKAQKKALSKSWTLESQRNLRNSLGSVDSDSRAEDVDDLGQLPVFPQQRKSISRRDNIDAKSLTMGLDEESANYLDWMTQAKCQEWLKSFRSRDPRHCIKIFFDDISRDGADRIEEKNGFKPELLSPLLSMFQRSSVFSVWRPTSMDSIRKMMTGQGTGKGLDIKGKSAKKGKLSAYVPFLQIHEEKHKTKIRLLPSNGRIRIFYKKREMRDNAQGILVGVLEDMKSATDAALNGLMASDKITKEDLAQDCAEASCLAAKVQRVLSWFRSVDLKDDITDEEQTKISTLDEWSMDDPQILVLDDYVPKCYGLDIPKRLFWEGYVMRAADITREPGSEFDTGRPSRASFQDMNFGSIKDEEKCDPDMPRAVVWQYTDPYLPPTEPDPDPMMPQTLLMAYEEHGRVMPVVSDFDCFLLGTRGVRFHTPIPEDQVEFVHNMLGNIENILKDNREGKSNNWTGSWLNTMKHQKKHVTMPKYGFGDPKSYAIMRHAVHRLEESGAVRHGAECFNFYFPQDLDDEFLVIGGNLGGDKYKYMKLAELQEFLSSCIDLGFTFPLNPKWTLCDEGWGALWDKLTGSTHPNVQLSINAWYPPGSGLMERIQEIRQSNPDGFRADLSCRKKGTQAWDEAEIALDRYQRIQRAKRKLWAVLCWISIVQQSRKKVLLARQEEDVKVELRGEVGDAEVEVQMVKSDRAMKRVSFHHDPTKRMSSTSTMDSDFDTPPTSDETKEFRNRANARTRSEGFISKSSSLLSEGEEDNIEVIDSVLNSCLSLTEYQMSGLQKIRKQMAERSAVSQHRINNRVERRHTSASVEGRSRANMMLEGDVPSFILKEYGGLRGEMKISFKAQVKKIITAQRLLATARECIDPPVCDDSTFLPVEWTSMSTEKKNQMIEKLSFSALKRWDYNIIEVAKLCDGSPLLFIGWAILGSPHAQQAMARDLDRDTLGTCGYGFVTELRVQIPILCTFLRTVEADYQANPYHNNTHAADVVQTLNTMLQLGGKEFASSPLDIFSILVAAVIHDVKHPGLNNNFQINSRSELAVQYNDISVLENYSITWLFSKLLGKTRDFTVDIFSGLSNEQFAKARSIIIRSVLETDMTHHFDLLKKMGIHQETLKGRGPVDWLQTYSNEGVNYDPSMDMLCFLLHQADISNPAKPYPLFVEWADNILAECYAQGDKEVSLSLPVSPLCDRVSSDKKQCQIGFIKFVVRPSYVLLGEIIPLFAKTVFPHIEKSLDFWDNYEEGSSD